MDLMRYALKVTVTVAVIITAGEIGKRIPTLAGLIAAMPITTLLVLFWIYSDRPGDVGTLAAYTKGVLWGIIPTILFFLTAYICFSKRAHLAVALTASFAVWLIAALVHQYLLRD